MSIFILTFLLMVGCFTMGFTVGAITCAIAVIRISESKIENDPTEQEFENYSERRTGLAIKASVKGAA